MSTSTDSAGSGEIAYHVILGILRAGSNILAIPVWGAILWALAEPFGLIDGADNIFEAFAIGFGTCLHWTFNSAAGVSVGLGFVALGIVHAIRIGVGRSYWSVLGFFAFLLDHTWSLANTVVGSVYATIMLFRKVHREQSKGAGALYLVAGLSSDYDTTLGNVIAGTQVPRHEFTHVIQAWICGPVFYPIYLLNYVVNTLAPLWLIPFALGWPYGEDAIEGFGDYFTKGVYPYTLFEMIAYAIQGRPPAYGPAKGATTSTRSLA